MKTVLLKFLVLAITIAGYSSELSAQQTKGLTFVYQNPSAPSLVATALDGTPYDLKTDTGKVVLVNFWATWCPPCVEELPSIQKITQQFDAKNLKVIAVNVGESDERINTFLNEFSPTLTFEIVKDEFNDIFSDWGVRGLPTSFIVSKQGNIIYKAEGPRDFASDHIQEKLAELIAQK